MTRATRSTSRRAILTKSGAAIAALGLAGCTGGENGGGDGDGNGSGNGGAATNTTSSGEEYDIKIAHTQPPEHVGVKTLKSEFVEPLEETTNGRITASVEAATLGGSEDNLDAAQAGTVEMVLESPPALASRFASEYSFAGDPFVIQGVEHYKAVQEEYLLPEDGLNGTLIENGLRLFDSHRWGNRGTTSNFPAKHPDDVQGLKIRLPQFDSWVGAWKEIGANPTPVSFDELYSALETGTVKASEGPISQFMAKSLYEVQSHFSETNHLLGMWHFIMNEQFYQGLSSEDQELFKTTIQEATGPMTETIRNKEEEQYEAAKEEGTTITREDSIDREAFVEAARPYLKQRSEEAWAVSLEDIESLA